MLPNNIQVQCIQKCSTARFHISWDHPYPHLLDCISPITIPDQSPHDIHLWHPKESLHVTAKVIQNFSVITWRKWYGDPYSHPALWKLNKHKWDSFLRINCYSNWINQLPLYRLFIIVMIWHSGLFAGFHATYLESTIFCMSKRKFLH